jgi:hypothetical protein
MFRSILRNERFATSHDKKTWTTPADDLHAGTNENLNEIINHALGEYNIRRGCSQNHKEKRKKN